MDSHGLQLELPLTRRERTPEELHAALSRHGSRPPVLTITRNRVSLVSVRFDASGAPRVRLSRALLGAPDEVIAALGQYLAKRSRDAWRVVAGYARSLPPAAHPARAARLSARGRVHDLEAIQQRMNRLYFGGRLACRIGWGRTGQARRRARTRSIRYGSYDRTLNLVRINPVLDDARVPVEFVEYIVFHELLHAAVPSAKGGARWLHHHETYRKLERRFPGHARMRAMAAELISTLQPERPSAARRTGNPGL